ncbi:hypothetical protein KQI13_14380, partial [Anaerostipes hadrus]|nr:hypothetical protein [Anaerostipes hadrus]
IQPMSKKDLNGYISLQDRKSKTKYQLDDDGIILTEKAASQRILMYILYILTIFRQTMKIL